MSGPLRFQRNLRGRSKDFFPEPVPPKLPAGPQSEIGAQGAFGGTKVNGSKKNTHTGTSRIWEESGLLRFRRNRRRHREKRSRISLTLRRRVREIRDLFFLSFLGRFKKANAYIRYYISNGPILI